MPGRKFTAGTLYRYGFNGKENDNEVKGEGNQIDYGWRVHDPRIGRFLSTDPISKDYPELTPYQYASNTPIQAIDLDGLEAAGVGFGWGMSQLQSTKAADHVAKGIPAMGKGFLHSAWNSLKSLATLTSPVPTPEKMQQTAAIYQAVTNPGQAYREIKKGLKQWGSNLIGEDPSVAGYALGQGLEFGAEFLIPIPLAKGAAGTRVAGRTIEEILDVSKGIASRGLLEDYALSTKVYKGFENANKTIVANNPVFDLINKAGDIVDVTSTAAKTLNANQFTKKLDRLAGLSNANSRTLQIYVKDGQYTADQLNSLGQKLTDHISTNQLQKTSFSITPIK